MLLPDVNVWLALTFDLHSHHPAAKSWFGGLSNDSVCCFCRLTQQGFLRLATNRSVLTKFPSRWSENLKPTMKSKRTAEQRAEEESLRRQHAAKPVRQRPGGTVNQQSFSAILSLLARFKAVRESQGLTLAEVAQRMEIDPPALSRLETGKMLNPTLATLHKWAGALGRKLDADLTSA